MHTITNLAAAIAPAATYIVETPAQSYDYPADLSAELTIEYTEADWLKAILVRLGEATRLPGPSIDWRIAAQSAAWEVRELQKTMRANEYLAALRADGLEAAERIAARW